MLLRSLLTLILLIISLTSCTGIPWIEGDGANNPATYEDPAKLAKQLESEGRYVESSKEYQRIATRSGPGTRQGYQLAAVRTLLKADMIDAAKAELATIQLQNNYGLNNLAELVQIRLAIAEQRIDEALVHLNAMNVSQLPKNLQIEHNQLQANILEAQGDVFGAVKKWISLDNAIGTDVLALRENHEILWHSLSLLEYNQLRQVQQTPGDVFSGWVSLAVLSKTIHPSYIAKSIADWQARYPNHPANKDIVQTIMRATQTNSTTAGAIKPIQKIALLLPLDSKFQAHAEATQNGISAAIYDDKQAAQMPEIIVSNVDPSNVANIYKEMVAQGIQVVIGPLDKESLAVLAQTTNQLPVLTIGLNYLDTNSNTNNLFQFGLSPEQEAQAVARRAWQDGHRVTSALIPPGNWSNRVLTAFQQEWAKQGGQFATLQQYDNSNLSQSVKNVVNSKADMVFMLAFPREARQLRPFFPYHDGENIAIYSTSHIYTGVVDQRMDRDLEGIIFGDMPWILSPDQKAKEWQATFEKSWPDDMEQVKRLYALGIDAYRLLHELKKLNQHNFLKMNGYTGLLSVENGGVITRQLLWARFIDGLPQLLEKQTVNTIVTQPVSAPVPIAVPAIPVPVAQ
jgi:hypothetical protein